MRFLAFGALVTLVLSARSAAPADAVLFRDVTEKVGVAFIHHSAPEKKHTIESMSGGVALFDYDNDGKLDIYFVDSLTVATAKDPKAARSALYHNKGDGTFEDVTEKAGVGYPGWAMGVCAADVDGDGWVDLYVTAFGGNRLYRNNHNGTFTDIAAKAGVVGDGWSTGCGFSDYDRDGHLDLFVSRYATIDLDHLPKSCKFRDIPVQCRPDGLKGAGDLLFHNDGNGHFTEVGERAGVSDPRAFYGLGIAWFDANGDGWPDLYVANDSTPSFLYINQKNGTFKESGFTMGVAVSLEGTEQGGMGVAIGDYDNSGAFSIYKTNFFHEYNNLFHNDLDHFTDVSFKSGTAESSLPWVKWGAAFLDYDNDGWLDIISVNGHIYPQLDGLDPTGTYRQPKLLYHNKGDGTFESVAEQYGEAITAPRVSRGLAIGDLDNDGRLDVVINDVDGHPQVLHNELANAGNWLMVKATGKGKNTSAIGAVIKLRAGGVIQERVIASGTSYLSQDDFRAHFGLGASKEAEWLQILWPDGAQTRRTRVKANQILEIRE
jgi:hypothetical protein